MIPFFLLQATGGSSARQQPTMVLEFPAPHIAILKPSPIIARLRKFGVAAAAVAFFVAAGLAIMVTPIMTALRSSQKFELEPLIAPMIIPIFLLGVFGVVVIVHRRSIGAKCITFDRRQGMMWKEARKLEPIWQGGIRVRDVASLELTATSVRGMASFSLDMVMSRPQGERVRLIAHGNRDAMKADAAELARFLNIPLTNANL